MKFDNSFQKLPNFFYENVKPTPLLSPQLIHVTTLKAKLGLKALSDQELLQWLNSEKRIEGDQRISTRYAGHQFGVWAGQLGDGRAISLGELITEDKSRLEIQTKGSGLTPFSRMGDGKAVIRSSVREYLCSIAMEGLNIPTTNVLALIIGNDEVYRETVERSALVARVFPSNIRFGHFEIAYHFKKTNELNALIEYSRLTFFDGISIEAMLEKIISTTANLIAHWQCVGFCHGVMNTDNMSILGLTIDFGPFGFLEDTNLKHICNHSDHHGRYAFNQQPQVAMWNLEKLLICFIDHVGKDRLTILLNRFPDIFQNYYSSLAMKKLGLKEKLENDFDLFVDLLKTLSILSFDYTFFFRVLCDYKPGELDSLESIWGYYGKRPELVTWLEKYDQRLKVEYLTNAERMSQMKLANPKFILRNYIAQDVIEEVEKGNDNKLKEWIKILQNPFTEFPSNQAYASPSPPDKKGYIVSCSS